MFLNKKRSTIVLLTLYSFFAGGQNKKEDSIKVNRLDEVIVTGQLKPQSIKKSVFEVKVITAEEIKRRAGNNLADVLNQTLNISIFQNSSTGKSEINVLGLGGKYYKVLIDNIPIINEEGFGNNIDFSTINLDDIERVELVEGAMGVQYGANALSGVLNIITKKNSKTKWTLNSYLQEETIGKEYAVFNKGRHIQSIGIAYKFNKEDYLKLSFNRNDFRGFLDTLKGKKHEKTDELRGYTWLPKKQDNAKLLFSHKEDGFSVFYKFDFFNEDIFSYNSIVRLNTNVATATTDPSAFDREFNNKRYIHHLNVAGKLFKVPYNISLSYQNQEKKLNRFTYFIRRDTKENIIENTFLSKNVWFSRGTFSNLINTKNIKLQIGYEVKKESGFGSSAAVGSGTIDNEVSNTLRNYDFFTSSEIDLTESFSIKPGARISFTNLFGNQFYYSLSGRKLFKNGWEARTILGYGTRTPEFDELFTFFVDVNHDVRGNLNLNPEKGTSAFLHIKKATFLGDYFTMKNKLTLSYIDVKDRIQLILVNQAPLAFKYNNIDEFTSIGSAFENQFFYKNLQLNIGASVFGVTRLIDSNTQEVSNRQTNFQLNASLSYSLSKWNTSLSAYMKYIGKTSRFIDVGGSFQTQIIDPYSWLDISAKTKLFNKKIEATLGVRNALDVTNVTTNNVSGTAHSGNTSNISLGYGRSYFLKIGYNINI